MGFYLTLLAYAALAVLMSMYALVLIVLRAKLFKTKIYKPMILNIFLAWVPVVIIVTAIITLLLMTSFANTTGVWVVAIIGLVLWLLFLPNAPYLITELNFSHRKENEKVPLYYDILQTLSLTVTGVFVGQFSLVLVHSLLVLMTSPGIDAQGLPIIPNITWWLMLIGIYMAAFAIYLGRNIRVNSWDVMYLIVFLKCLYKHLKGKSERRRAYGYVIFYGTFLAIMHIVFFGLLQAQLMTLS